MSREDMTARQLLGQDVYYEVLVKVSFQMELLPKRRFGDLTLKILSVSLFVHSFFSLKKL